MLRPRLGNALNASILATRCHESAALRGGSSRLARTIFTDVSNTTNVHEPAVIDFDMPPDYESQSFWDNRFKKEHHFEWLGDGKDTIVPILRPLLQVSASAHSLRVPRTLHIGAGTSSLSDHIFASYHDVFAGRSIENAIVNTDFAAQAVEKGRRAEKGKGRDAILWEQVDLLSWQNIVGLKEQDEQGVFDFVVDKSTSDAISCGETFTFSQEKLTNPSISLHPMLRAYLSRHPGEILQLEPLEILALHLAALVRPGGLWIALSYSNDRFPFLTSPLNTMGTEQVLDAGLYWKVDAVQTVNAPSGWGRLEGGANVHTPQILHYLYTFKRSIMPVV